MTDYVVGFMFTSDRKEVLLIQKNKPKWQVGRLNGVGGKIELGEYAKQAMVREFEEETGICTPEDSWTEFCMYVDKSSLKLPYIIHFFKSYGDIVHDYESKTSEELRLSYVGDVPNYNTIYNLKWLIPLALDGSLSFPIMVTE